MTRLLFLFLGVLVLVPEAIPAPAAGPKALALREAAGLTPFTPPEKFLAGNFIADEMNPSFIYGPVQAFAASRKCPTTWLIEEGDKNRLSSATSPEAVVEYTLYLEEDCGDQIVYYVFVDQSGLTPQQWLEWRRRFHKSKAEPQFGATRDKLERACQDGCGVGGELRYVLHNGELRDQGPEEILRQELKFPPRYDLNRHQKLSN
uniref:Uncharacterized protein n=1 Tax=Desulfobacca acetoxidans TaxID=60893 RepID=A0A7V4G732_9BACT